MSENYNNMIKDCVHILQKEIKEKNLKCTIAFSHQNEDAINIALAKKAGIDFDVFTLNTEKLFEESLLYQKEIEKFFDLKIKELKATKEQIEKLESKLGEDGISSIYSSIELRKECCRVRKLLPLKEALSGYEAWISGIRSAQSITRSETKIVDYDDGFNILKINPLANFDDEDVKRFIKEEDIPQNSLYAKGFLSIGCKPCTRAVSKGEDARSGRWWWENPEHKECGLHIKKDNRSKPNHLKALEDESIFILREVVANFSNPVMMYSIGKDSSVMLHLAQKAFFPSKIPFPLLHVDTTWKFKEMVEFRDRMAREIGFDLIVHINEDGKKMEMSPFTHGSKVHTDVMKTEALKQALNRHNFDAIIGGARRDEEKSRAKERIFSFRDKNHRWDPKNQRPELWNIFNTNIHKGESVRVFPISNWTESDIWQYIESENIPIVPLYFAKPRKVVKFEGIDILVDDDRVPKELQNSAVVKNVRFRTLGCYPLTGAMESNADTLEKIVEETICSRTSERDGRAIDKDQDGSMEKKKIEGYF